LLFACELFFIGRLPGFVRVLAKNKTASGAAGGFFCRPRTAGPWARTRVGFARSGPVFFARGALIFLSLFGDFFSRFHFFFWKIFPCALSFFAKPFSKNGARFFSGGVFLRARLSSQTTFAHYRVNVFCGIFIATASRRRCAKG
jgi:hypothetical protein